MPFGRAIPMIVECGTCGAVAEVFIDDPNFPRSFRIQMRGNFPEKCRRQGEYSVPPDDRDFVCKALDAAIVAQIDRQKK